MLTAGQRQPLIEKIRSLPALLRETVHGLDEHQLTTHTMPGEWTVAQNVHHLADSHMNSYIRFKLILTEEHPTLKPYDQDVWAAFDDASSAAIETSLRLLEGLHARWAVMLDTLPEDAWGRAGFHPEAGEVSVVGLLQTYAAHGEGHIDQIRRTLAAGGFGG